MAGAEPFPLTVAVPFEGELSRLQAREEALVSESVALSSLAVQVAFVSSSMVLVSGPAPWVMTGEELTGCKKVMTTFPCPVLAPMVLFWSVPLLKDPPPPAIGWLLDLP